jgi:ribosomal-protein-alanine N-acetyltransferase
MKDKTFVTTPRLFLTPLSPKDEQFILELVNTEGWLKFIGDRNIHSQTDAAAYIGKILGNRNISYWVVKLKEKEEKMGVITFIKRDYLEYHDIGFAFLPAYSGKGYAYEATKAGLHQLINQQHLKHVLATTIPENTSSIKLLTRLGMVFEKDIQVGKEKLFVYGAPATKLMELTGRK